MPRALAGGEGGEGGGDMRQRDSLSLVLKAVTPSRNEVDKHHWGWRAKQVDHWIEMLTEALSDQHLLGFRAPALRHATVIFTRIGKRILDDDNLSGGMKQLRDALTRRALIMDDSPQWMDALYRQRRCPKGKSPHTLVTIVWDRAAS